MKKIFTILVTACFYTVLIMPAISIAQAPAKMSYQTVIRNTSGNLVVNQSWEYKSLFCKQAQPVQLFTLKRIMQRQIPTALSAYKLAEEMPVPEPFLVLTGVQDLIMLKQKQIPQEVPIITFREEVNYLV